MEEEERKNGAVLGGRQSETGRAMGAVERIFIWETLFWFGQMWEPEAKPHSQM